MPEESKFLAIGKSSSTVQSVFFDAPVIRKASTSASAATNKGGESGVSSESSAFQAESLGWQELTPGTKVTIPKQFSIATVTEYLTTLPVSLVAATSLHDDDEQVDAGTSKPTVKGRQMYVSKRLTLVEYAEATFVTIGQSEEEGAAAANEPTDQPMSIQNLLYFRGNCYASMRKMVRYPGMSSSLLRISYLD